MTSREHPSEAQEPAKTFTEWGVRRRDYYGVLVTMKRYDEDDARSFAEVLDRADDATVVSRTVTRTQWRPVSEGGAPDA